MALLDGLEIEIDDEVKAKIEEHVSAEHNAALEAEKLAFKQKMNGLDAKLKAEQEKASAFDGISPDEIAVLRKAKSSNAELSAALEEYKTRYSEKERLLAERESQLQELDTTQKLSNTLSQYEAAENALPFHKGAQQDALKTLRERMTDIDGNTVFKKADGSPFVTENGYGDAQQFISNVLRQEKPWLFQQPTGGGAPGQNSIHGSAKTGDMGGDKKSRSEAIAQKFNLPRK